MPTGEEQNEDERNGRPQVARVESRLQGVERKLQDREADDRCAAAEDEVGVVEWPNHCRVEGGVQRDPLGDAFGGDGTGGC